MIHCPERRGIPARALALLVTGFACAGLAAAPAQAIQLPPGFTDQVLPFTFDVPTCLAFLPDGRLLVAEKGGIIYVVKDTVRRAIWVREEEVLNADDRGLISIAVDPRFAQNRFLYFLYSVDPDSNGIELDNYDDAFGRLTRYQLSAADSNALDDSTRTILIGDTWTRGFPSPAGSHPVAGMEWGRDGSLLVGCGDGAHFETVDPGGLDPNAFGPGKTDPLEDIGSFRSLDLESLNGKILRIDPATGHGYPSNPYFDGDATSHRSRVWAYGLRNPFRFARKPFTGALDPALGQPGTLYIGDVGWMTWEEIDVAKQGGENFGWPCAEGMLPQADYQAASPAHGGCASQGADSNPAPPLLPIIALHHVDTQAGTPPGFSCETMIGGCFYTGSNFPAAYVGQFFFGDYIRNWVRVLVTDPQDQLIAVEEFATDADGPVSFVVDPQNGDLLYAAIYTGMIHRIRYTGTTSVDRGTAPAGASLSAAWPNPVSGAVSFTLALRDPARVEFSVYDVAGRQVWRAPERERGAGHTTLAWSGTDVVGARAKPGIYLARVAVDGHALSRRFAILR